MRIINGRRVIPNKYPWMAVMLSSLGNQVCGGSVISDKTIVTAGHCMYYTRQQLQTKWLVAVDSVKEAKGLSTTHHIYKTVRYDFHPNFKNSPIFDDFDMSIVTVDRPIQLSRQVGTICLPYANEHEHYYNTKVNVAGWGKLTEERTAPVSDVLMETSVFLKTPATCKAMTELAGYNERSMVCAHDYQTDACLGDSGWC
jgi:trypsin